MTEEQRTQADLEEEARSLRAELTRLRGAENGRQRAEEALRESEERFRLLVETAGDALYRLRYATMTYEYLSPAVERLTGYTPQELKKVSFASLVEEIRRPGGAEVCRDDLVARRKSGLTGELSVDYLIRTKCGQLRWLGDHSFPWRDDEGLVIGSVGILSDVSRRKKAEEDLRASEERFRYLATHDSLTGLYNTRYLYEALPELLEASAAAGEKFSLIFMDLDNFKQVVDTHGHLLGSQALQEVATTIGESLVPPAYGVAYGGDEFVVVLPGMGPNSAWRQAEDIRARMNRTAYLGQAGHRVRLRASFGVATYPDDASDLIGLLARADQAMFQVKADGKDAIRSVAWAKARQRAVAGQEP